MASIPCPTRATRSSMCSSPGSNSNRVEPSQKGVIINSGIVLISTEEAVPAPLVVSHMCVEGAVLPVTPHPTARKRSNNSMVSAHRWQQQQLQEETYLPQTPLKRKWLEELLRHHPDSDKVTYVLQGLRMGFDFRFRAPKNLPTAQLDPKLIQDKITQRS